jgi:transposase
LRRAYGLHYLQGSARRAALGPRSFSPTSDRRLKPAPEIHIILGNLSVHKTNQVEEFLERNSHVKLHFTPTYSSWLNQVDIWFARLEREVIARGIFTSVTDLSRNLMRYMRAYSKNARPFKWKYSNVRRRILPRLRLVSYSMVDS